MELFLELYHGTKGHAHVLAPTSRLLGAADSGLTKWDLSTLRYDDDHGLLFRLTFLAFTLFFDLQAPLCEFRNVFRNLAYT
jgi:hypothetical protein